MAISYRKGSALRRTFHRAKNAIVKGAAPTDEGARSAAQAWDIYDRAARTRLGMGAEEFERRWEQGEFRSRAEDSAVLGVRMMRTKRPD